MKKIKNCLLIIFIVLSAFSFIGCGSDNNDGNNNPCNSIEDNDGDCGGG